MGYKFNPISGTFDIVGSSGSSAPTEYNAGNSGSGSITINWNNGSQQALTLTGNPTITFSNGSAGGIYTLRLIQDGTGSRTVIYNPLTGTGKVIPSGGAQTFPTLSTTPSFRDFMVFYYDGTYYYLIESDIGFNPSDYINTKSLLLDGSSKYCSLGNAFTALDYNTPFSMSVWFKMSSTCTNNPLITRAASSNDQGIIFRLTTNAPQIQLIGASSSVTATWGVGLSTATWYNAVFTYAGDGSTLKMYVNAGAAATGTGSLTGTITTGDTAYIGRRTDVPSFFPGHMDEISVWGVVLSASDVSTIYNSGTPTDLSQHPQYTHLLNWWRMGDSPDSTSTLFDRKGTLNATCVNIVSGDFTTDVP